MAAKQQDNSAAPPEQQQPQQVSEQQTAQQAAQQHVATAAPPTDAPTFTVRAKAGRTAVRTHEDLSPEQMFDIVAKEGAYTLGGGAPGQAATKLEVDPDAGGQRWEVYFILGRAVKPKSAPAPVMQVPAPPPIMGAPAAPPAALPTLPSPTPPAMVAESPLQAPVSPTEIPAEPVSA